MMKLYDGLAGHTYMVRLFIEERKGLSMDVQSIDVMHFENRRLQYRQNINSRGEVPALQLDSGKIITETVAICEYFDEVANGGASLLGSTAEERAETRMRLRQMDLELVQPAYSWWRNDPEKSLALYKGARMPQPDMRVLERVKMGQALNRLDDELEGKEYLCGDRFSFADVYFYGLVKLLVMDCADWITDPGRVNVAAYFSRMDARPASQKAMMPYTSKVDV